MDDPKSTYYEILSSKLKCVGKIRNLVLYIHICDLDKTIAQCWHNRDWDLSLLYKKLPQEVVSHIEQLHGFRRKGDSLKAKLLAIYDGSHYYWEEGFRRVVCEYDFVGAIPSIRLKNVDQEFYHKHKEVIGDIRENYSAGVGSVMRCGYDKNLMD
ncbi:hypothetical protein Fmac_008958 [Flemingia macrophylla]|uniref:Uncharacterized protein n=1 Tax=Flemingia macrophylla TaxID=520843 RepID=A0ABD1MYZ1_9FABA